MSEPERSATFDEQAFRLAAELAGLGLWRLDLSRGHVTLSARAAELYGAPAETAISPSAWRAAVDLEDRPRAERLLDQIAAGEAEGTDDLTVFGSGEPRRLRETWRATAWNGDQPSTVFGVVQDVTEEFRGQQRRRELIHELQHRMKNVLAVIRSLARRTAAHSGSVEEFSAYFDGRLGALAQVQTTLARTQDGRADLEDMVRQELVQSIGSDADVDISGPAVALRGRTAELLALALHELAVNAVQFGSLSEGGEVAVSWRVQPEGSAAPTRLELDWIETGLNEAARIDQRGFGMDLIQRGLPYELEAVVDVDLKDRRLSCRIVLPLPGPG